MVAPPSQHASGKTYTWTRTIEPLRELPACFVAFANTKRKINIASSKQRTSQPSPNRFAVVHNPPARTQDEEERIRSALNFIPADDRETWLRVGMALHWTGWGDAARPLWDSWSQKSAKFDEPDQDKTWESFERRTYSGPVATLGTLFNLAKQHGWSGRPADEIDELNARHFVIGNIGGKCLIGEFIPNPLGAGTILSFQGPDAFRTRYNNRKIVVRDSEGNERRKPLGTAWLDHPQRRQYDGVDLAAPPRILPHGHMNLWRGYGVDARSGDWSLMMAHIYHVLAAGDRKAAEYILRYVAWCFQNPGERAEVALVLRGGKGSGKGIFVNAIARCFGEHALHIFSQAHLTGNFNAHLRPCLFLFADEAFWAGDKKAESVLKGLITEATLVIEQKGIDAVQWPNRLKVIMAANAEWVVPASYDERRFVVIDVSNRYAQGACPESELRAYFDALLRELESGGYEAMLHDLRGFAIGDFHPRQIIQTEGLRRQKEASLSSLDQWWVDLLQEGRLPGARVPISGHKREPRNFSQTSDLVNDAKIKAPRSSDYLSNQKLATYLKGWGCTRHRDSHVRGWIFPPLPVSRKEWARRYGGWEWEAPDLQDWQ